MISLRAIFLKSILGMICILMISCTKSKDHKEDPTPADPYAFKFDEVVFKVDKNLLTSTQKTLINGLLTSNSSLKSAALISHALTIQHTAAAHVNSSTSDILNFKNKIDFFSIKDPYDLKYVIEQQVEKKFNSPLKYNYGMSSMLDIINGNQMQCFSGSMLYGNLALLHSTIFPALSSLVMIHTNGHVLPGFVDNGQLFGVEMTVAGRGEVKYDSVQNKLPLNMIVVQMHYALLASALKTALLDMAILRDSIIEVSARNLNLNYPSNALDVYASYNPGHLKNTFNTTIFSFGSSNVPVGAVDRITIDQVSPSTSAPNSIPVVEEPQGNLGPIQVIVAEQNNEENKIEFKCSEIILKQLDVGAICKTAKGGHFMHVVINGEPGIKDITKNKSGIQDGKIWFNAIAANVNLYQALRECTAKSDQTLPKKTDFELAESRGLREVFSGDMADKFFWSSSIKPFDDSEFAFVFNCNYKLLYSSALGNVDEVSFDYFPFDLSGGSARCVYGHSENYK